MQAAVGEVPAAIQMQLDNERIDVWQKCDFPAGQVDRAITVYENKTIEQSCIPTRTQAYTMTFWTENTAKMSHRIRTKPL